MIDRNRKVKWGILGCGKIAHKFAYDLLLSDNSELVACVSRDVEKSTAFAEKYNIRFSFDSYEDFARCEEIDVVYIATPNSYHKEHSLLCLSNKKAVLCEKPLATNKADVEEMIKVAQENKVFFMEAMWTSCLPNIISINNTIQKGVIGELIHITADFGFKTGYDPKSRLFDPNLGGGSLLDIGIYPLYISLLLLGKPKSIRVSMRYCETGVDTSCSALLSYENGATAALFSSFETVTDIKCEIYGTEGKIVIPGRFHEQKEYLLSKQGFSEQLIKSEQVGLGYYHEIEHVNECLYRGEIESFIMPFRMSLDLIEIMDEMRFKSEKFS